MYFYVPCAYEIPLNRDSQCSNGSIIEIRAECWISDENHKQRNQLEQRIKQIKKLKTTLTRTERQSKNIQEIPKSHVNSNLIKKVNFYNQVHI